MSAVFRNESSPAPAVMEKSLAPGWTVDPSSTKSSVMTPEHGAFTGIEVLSVSMWQISSSSLTESPTAGKKIAMLI